MPRPAAANTELGSLQRQRQDVTTQLEDPKASQMKTEPRCVSHETRRRRALNDLKSSRSPPPFSLEHVTFRLYTAACLSYMHNLPTSLSVCPLPSHVLTSNGVMHTQNATKAPLSLPNGPNIHIRALVTLHKSEKLLSVNIYVQKGRARHTRRARRLCSASQIRIPEGQKYCLCHHLRLCHSS